MSTSQGNDQALGKDLTSIQDAAERGDPTAQYELSVRLHEGVGIEIDKQAAAKWFQLAAENGYRHAKYSLSLLNDVGLSAYWALVAAAQGDYEAEIRAECLLRRFISPPDDFDLEAIHNQILVGQKPPLAWIPWITTLDFTDRPLQSVVLLSDFYLLGDLKLEGTEVNDITPLARLEKLQWLDLSRTRVNNIEPLSGLVNLEYFFLSETQVTDLTPLMPLRNLKWLHLRGTGVGDLVPLAGHDIEDLDISETRITDLGPLKAVSSLKLFKANGTHVADLTALSELVRLEELELAWTEISELVPLAGLAALRHLWLGSTPVKDISPLARLSSLQVLWIAHTCVARIEPLAQLQNLQVLDLSFTPVQAIDALAGLPLQTLWLAGTRISDISLLADMKDLRRISLSFPQCGDPAPLSGLASLEKILVESELERSALAAALGNRGDLVACR